MCEWLSWVLDVCPVSNHNTQSLYLHSIGRLIQALLRSLTMQHITPSQKVSGCSLTLKRQFKEGNPHLYFFACTHVLTASFRSCLIHRAGDALSCSSGLSRSMAAPWESHTDSTLPALRSSWFSLEHNTNTLLKTNILTAYVLTLNLFISLSSCALWHMT